jgi:alpha-glucosidase
MEFFFPNQGFENIKDQFMLGEKIFVAPVDSKVNSRKVILPKGKWTDDQGKTWDGGKTITIDVPIDRIPVFMLN